MQHSCNSCRYQSASGGFCRRFARFISDIPFAGEECEAFVSRYFIHKAEQNDNQNDNR